MMIFTKDKVHAVTLGELRSLELSLQSAMSDVDYTNRRIAELTEGLPAQIQRAAALEAEFTDNLKRFKEQ